MQLEQDNQGCHGRGQGQDQGHDQGHDQGQDQGRGQGQNRVGPFALACPGGLIPDAIYWPFKRLPESKLEAYAGACLETALKSSEEAREIYVEIVSSWELSGCQLLIGDFARYKQDYRTWMRKRAESVARNEPPPDWPKWIGDVVAKYKYNTAVLDKLQYFLAPTLAVTQ